jgi:NAD kinase
MDRLTESKILLIVRETRLEELKARFNTVSQARFYVEQLGGDFTDYELEDATYRQAVTQAQQVLTQLGRLQVVQRSFLPNFIFGPSDLVVAVGQDGLVANTLKYLDGQPLIGVNPDPRRYDGKLLPFKVRDLATITPEVLRQQRPLKSVTMAKASLNDGQTLYAVNDLFIGPKSHGSARYTLHHGTQRERHSSSGVIVSTGLGSTGWFSSLLAGAQGLMAGIGQADRADSRSHFPKLSWDTPYLVFTVREPFPSQTTTTQLVFGRVNDETPLVIESHMPERGVIFSDGFESDFLEFNSGARAEIQVANRQGMLVV